MKKLLLLFFCTFSTLKCFSDQISEDQNQFALTLFSEIASQESGNFAFSPYSIFSNLTLLYFGADQQTSQQIQDTLHLSMTGDQLLKSFQQQLQSYSSNEDKGYKLAVANGLFLNKDTQILNSFRTIAKNFFDANVQTVDYSSPKTTIQTINLWVSQRTQGKIPSLLQEEDINSATKLILANAVYFEGEWETPFNPKNTQPASFYSTEENTDKVNMMHLTANFSYFEDEQMQGIVLPFYRTNTNFPGMDCLVLLPKKDTSLEDMENNLSTQDLSNWLKNGNENLVELTIPKFCFNFKIPLNEPLQKMGMQDAFTNQANFSKINGMKNLSVQQVIHDTYFSFQENGVTAASSTTTHIGITSVNPGESSPIPFIADHPFLFVVFDRSTQAILFMGQVKQPTIGDCNGD